MQKALAMSEDGFERIKAMRETQGFKVDSVVVEEGQGLFYIIQTNPNHIPNRYKFRYTTDLQNRLTAFRAVCPNLKHAYLRCG